jgi:zinc protease
LRLLVEERAGSALTAVEITVKSGSGAQMAQDGGAAHLIEHLVFRGSAKRKPGEADIIMESLGGEILARTTRDVTQWEIDEYFEVY